jgi:hypothetical protein
MNPMNSSAFGLGAAAMANGPCHCQAGSQQQLALIGAAFVAGMATGRGAPMPIGAAQGSDEPVAPKPHRIPALPIRLDGKKAAPESVKDFDGKALHYVLDEAAIAGETMSVFTTPEKAQAFIAGLAPRPAGKAAKSAAARALITLTPSSTPQQVADAIGGAVLLYKDINFAGAQWRFQAGFTGYPQRGAGDGPIRDFRSVYCFLWWCQNIDNAVSSIQNQIDTWADVKPQTALTVLHDLPGFGGSTLLVPQRASIASLVPLGWNDRVSSLSYRLV